VTVISKTARLFMFENFKYFKTYSSTTWTTYIVYRTQSLFKSKFKRYELCLFGSFVFSCIHNFKLTLNLNSRLNFKYFLVKVLKVNFNFNVVFIFYHGTNLISHDFCKIFLFQIRDYFLHFNIIIFHYILLWIGSFKVYIFQPSLILNLFFWKKFERKLWSISFILSARIWILLVFVFQTFAIIINVIDRISFEFSRNIE